MKTSCKVTIEGTKPILINTFPIDTLSPGKAKSGTTGKDEVSWIKTVLMDENRNLYVLPSYIVGAIISGGKHIKVGKGSLSKKVGSTLEVLENRILLEKCIVPKETEILELCTEQVYIDVRSVVNPMTKGRNVRYRVGAREGWKASATISWDDRSVSKEEMKQCLENGGMFEGIGDGRKIGFGRFKVLSFSSL